MTHKVHLTEAQARKYGFVKGRKPKVTKTERGPYRWRCRCGVEGSGHKAADGHVAPGHTCFETILDQGGD